VKLIFLILFSIANYEIRAHEIEGTVVLEGSLKTETIVNSRKGTCKVSIKDVKNLMLEDQYGNPAYRLYAEINLVVGDFFSKEKIRFNETYFLTNLFYDGVKDYEYFDQQKNVLLKINNDGRLDEVTFTYRNTKVNCKF